MILHRAQGPLKARLDGLYREYNDERYIRYDPIKYVYRFEDSAEKELVGLLSSSLSFGRVSQIFKAMDRLLEIVDNQPLKYVLNLRKRPDRKLLSFTYRFVTGQDIYDLFASTRAIIKRYETLGTFVKQNYKQGKFLELVTETIKAYQKVNYLIPSSLKSPCKRLFMYFRWMVRDDNIDTGLWDFMDPCELVIPLDTHIFRVGTELGLTSRRSPSLNTAIEITNSLRRYCAYDPVMYDWALSHIGIIRNNFALESKNIT